MLGCLLCSLCAQIHQAYPQQRCSFQIERTHKLSYPFLCFLADRRVRSCIQICRCVLICIRSRTLYLYLRIFHFERHGVLNPLHRLIVH
ncbi:hypothetical protein D3C74_252080 [compost metagenome]